jgi:SAM-dependent methyltransferase
MFEIFKLIYLHFAVKIYELFQQMRVVKSFYHDTVFKAADQALLKGLNPYRIKAAFPYGETPLCSLKQIADRFGLSSSDKVVDLGCGRGRGILFLSHFYGCLAHGVDQVPTFIQKARSAAQNFPRISYSCADLRTFDFSKATFVFFYGTSFSDRFIDDLVRSLKALPSKSKIVSVSAPLPHYLVIDQCTVSFPWGRGEVFLQVQAYTIPINY